MKKFYLFLMSLLLIMVINQASAQHFQTVWSGNPYQVMNFVINNVKIDGIDVEAGDEIAVFDLDGSGNEICVGVTVLTGPPTSGNPALLEASTDDPTTPDIDGFTPGNSIIYRLWDSSEQEEITSFDATYNTTPPFVDVYTSFGTAIVGVEFYSAVKVTASTLSTCPGLVNIPINIANFRDVTEFSLVLDYNESQLIYDSYQNLNAQLNGGTFNLIDTGGEIEMTWSAGSAANISDATLIELVYDAQIFYSQTLSDLIWNANESYFVDVNGDTLVKDLIDGVITIEPMPEDAGIISGSDAICQGTSGEAYSVNTINNASSYVWSLNPSSSGTINGTGATISIDWSGSFTGQAVLTVYGNNNCGDGNPSTLNITISPNPTADAGQDDEICENGSFQLQGVATDYSSLQWTTSGDGTFDDASSLTPLYNPGSQDGINGSVVLTLTANAISPCSDPATDNMTLTLAPLPEVSAGANDSICENSTYTLSGTASNQSTMLWTTSGDGSFSDASVLNPVYTPGGNDISAGSVDLTLTAEAALPCTDDASDVMTLSIIHPPTANAGPDDAACENAPYTLSGNASNYSSLLWTTAGDGTFDDASILNATYTPGSNDLINGSVELSLTAEPILPCTGAATDNLILSVYISPTADAGADGLICENNTYTLNGAATNYSSVEWTTSGDGVFDDATSLTPTYTPGGNDIVNGTVDLSLTSFAIPPCTYNDVDQMTINIQALPEVYAGADDSVCNENPDYTLNPTVSASSSLLWTTAGDGTFNDPNIENAVYSPGPNDILNGSVLLTLTTDPIAPCANDDSDDILLNIIPSPMADAGTDDTVCENISAYLLAGANSANESSVLWSTAGDGSFNDASMLNATYTPGQGDLANASVTLTLTANPISPCSNPAADEMTLNFAPLPLADAGNDDSVCENSSFQLAGNAQHQSSVLWVSSGDGTFDDPSILSPVYNPGTADATNGSVDLTLTAYAGLPCTDNDSDIITLSVMRLPTTDAGIDDTICEDSPIVTLSGSATDYDHVLWSTTGDGTFDDNTILNPAYTAGPQDIANGEVELLLTAYPNAPCVNSISDSKMIYFQYAPTADAGADALICENQTYTLSGTAEHYSSVAWTTSGDGTFSDYTSLSPVYTPGGSDIINGTVTLTLTSYAIMPCSNDASDEMTISIQELPEVYAGVDDSVCIDNPDYSLNATASNQSGVLWSTSGDGSFSDPAILNPVYSPGSGDLAAGEVTLSIVVDPIAPCGNNASDNMLLSIIPLPVADAGLNDTICMNTPTYQIQGAGVQNQSSFMWSSSGDGTFDDPMALNPIYTPGSNDISNGSVDLILSAYSINPCNVTAVDSMLLTFSVLPTADAGADDLICETDTYTLSGAAEYYSSIQWTTSGDGTFDDPGTLNPVYTPGSGDILSEGATLTMTAYPNYPCTDPTPDDMFLEIQRSPVADAGLNDTICMNTPTYQIQGAGVQNQSSFMWSSSGDGTFDDPMALNPIYTPGSNDISNGSVDLILSAYSINPCNVTAVDSMLLTFSVLPTSDAGADDLICETDTYTLSGAAEYYSSILWTSSGDGIFDDPGILNPVYTPGSGDILSEGVTLTITAYPNYPCTDPTPDDMFLEIQRLPVADAPADDTVCMDTPEYPINGATVGNQDSMMWSTSGDGTFSDPYLLNPVYFPGPTDIDNGSVVLTLTAYAITPCVNDSSDSMNLVFALLPTSNAGPDDTACEAEGYQLNGSAENYSSTYWYSSGDGTIDDPGNLNAIYTPGEEDGNNGSVNLILFAYAMEPCTGEGSDTLVLQVNPIPETNAGEDATICEGESYTLSGEASDFESIEWSTSGDGTFDDPTLLAATYTPGTADIANGMVDLTLTAYQLAPCSGNSEDVMQLSIELAPDMPDTPSGPELVDVSVTASTDYSINNVPNTSSYEWELIPEEAGILDQNGTTCTVNWVNPPVADTAFLSVTAINNCGSGTSEQLNILTFTSVGIGEYSGVKVRITIVPNPTNGHFQVLVKGAEEQINIDVISADGKVISSRKQLNSFEGETVTDFDLSNQPKGLYYLRLYNNRFYEVRKLILN